MEKAVSTIIAVDGIRKVFAGRRGPEPVVALKNIDLRITRGESVGIVGESGSGKTTLARILVGLEKSSGGKIYFAGRPLDEFSRKDWFEHRRKMQFVFQDPQSSLNPRMRVGTTLKRPLEIFKIVQKPDLDNRVRELLEMVGLRAEHARRFPHELSGGQQQRVGIARALAVEPEVVVMDEPTSALDVSVQSLILELLLSLKQKLNLTYVFISHNIAATAIVSNRMIIMQNGAIVEDNLTENIIKSPQENYTKKLLNSVPDFYKINT